MSKYQSRETPVPGSSISETHPGYWTDCIKWERNIRNRWYIDYGHHFFGKKSDPSSSGTEPHEKWVQPHEKWEHGHGAAQKGLQKGHGCISGPKWPPKGLIPQVTSDIADPDESSVLTAPIGWYNYNDQNAEGNVKYKQAIVQGQEVKAPEMAFDYPTPGNTQKHHVVKDHVTAYSSSFGHHSFQFRNQNEMHSGSTKTPASASYFYLRPRSSHCKDGAPHTKQPHDRDKSKQQHDESDSISDILEDLVPLKPDGYVDLDKLSMQAAGCTWDEFQKWRKSLPGPEVCPKCENRLGCICVPRRREKIPEDPGTSPDEELPPWPPQVWCGPTYNGSRRGSLGDILRLRYRLSRDPEWKTTMNRMYDEMKAVNYYGKGQHAGEDSFSCGVCRTAREAGRGTWFDEQLRKGNPFTTGDTQFKSSMYSRKP